MEEEEKEEGGSLWTKLQRKNKKKPPHIFFPTLSNIRWSSVLSGEHRSRAEQQGVCGGLEGGSLFSELTPATQGALSSVLPRGTSSTSCKSAAGLNPQHLSSPLALCGAGQFMTSVTRPTQFLSYAYLWNRCLSERRRVPVQHTHTHTGCSLLIPLLTVISWRSNYQHLIWTINPHWLGWQECMFNYLFSNSVELELAGQQKVIIVLHSLLVSSGSKTST